MNQWMNELINQQSISRMAHPLLKRSFSHLTKSLKKILFASLLSKVVSAHVSVSWAETTCKLSKKFLAFLKTLLNVKKSFFDVNIIKIWLPNGFYIDIFFP